MLYNIDQRFQKQHRKNSAHPEVALKRMVRFELRDESVDDPTESREDILESKDAKYRKQIAKEKSNYDNAELDVDQHKGTSNRPKTRH